MERLGVLGGTFDPIHNAHIVAACAARHAFSLDRVLLTIARDPWQKHGAVVASAEDRFALVESAIDGIVGLEASRLEIEREGPTYTADTLMELRAERRELFLIVGSDAAAGIPTWDRAHTVCATATLIIVDRAGDPRRAELGPEWRSERLVIPRLDISSTEIRRRIAAGEPVDGLTPSGVVREIAQRHLYTRS